MEPFYIETTHLAAKLKAAGSPTAGIDAGELWTRLSGRAFPAGVSAELYTRAGYVPFAGYPLTRAKP